MGLSLKCAHDEEIQNGTSSATFKWEYELYKLDSRLGLLNMQIVNYLLKLIGSHCILAIL